MGWKEYWKGKNHKRKRLCNKLVGIDSFYIFDDSKYYKKNREDYFAFNKYDQNYKCIIKVKLTKKEFRFSVNDEHELQAVLLKDGFHVSTYHSFLNSCVGYPISIQKSSYIIPIEKLEHNKRVFFRCPDCNRRMRKLYYEQGKFLCRKCLNLGYRSQRIRPKKLPKLSIEERLDLWDRALNKDDKEALIYLGSLYLEQDIE
jgi:hypothetical protein